MMKKIWKAVFTIFAVLVVAGLICGAVSWFLGGSMDKLLENKTAAPVLEMLSPQNILNNIYA
ncbi:MAG: hypothetical protein GX488_10680, partial [Clostridiales bacterium]|nr:hypothetical protein [Clostridiales bacterium]